MTEPAYVEIGKRYSYAGALEWPGWCRHAKAGGDAVAALAAYGARYRDALALSGITFDPPADASGLEVVEHHEGDSGIEYGIPSVVPEADRRALDEVSVARLVAILQACWSAFDKAAQDAIGHELRKGPRGGGRDLDGTIEHLIESDVAYLSKLGARKPRIENGDRQLLLAALRARALGTFRARALGQPIEEPSRARELWPPRFYVSHAAWHALHHAWEIEDRVVVR
ncbi:MAG: hypothetical protein ACC726_12205 [Chloroflexota bacterium]